MMIKHRFNLAYNQRDANENDKMAFSYQIWQGLKRQTGFPW